VRILVLGKYPPIQGGTSSQVLNTVRHLAASGHEIDVVTNGWEAEPSCRALFTARDEATFEALHRVGGPGTVTIHYTSPLGPTAYIPWAQPFGSKLFGIGVDLARSKRYDLVVGWYFEPYGLVAGQIAEIAGAPLLLRHAGSDVGRLSRHPDLRLAYSWLLGRADFILTGPRSRALLIELGADPRSFRGTGPGLLPDYFDGPSMPIGLAELKEAATAQYASMNLSEPVRTMLVGNLRATPDGPVIGVTGKVARSKGSYDMVAALERVAAEGIPFTLLGALGGQESLLLPFFEKLAATEHLRSRSIILPFLPPWRMPSFFDACDLVCMLERSFDVALHRTRVPQEVLHRGRALILSDEIARKVYFHDRLRVGVNHLGVEDPEDTDALVAVFTEAISRPSVREAVAREGAELARELSTDPVADGPTVAILEALADVGAGATPCPKS
jgi:glycosyltransferase involved in cell wall biosynthesis